MNKSLFSIFILGILVGIILGTSLIDVHAKARHIVSIPLLKASLAEIGWKTSITTLIENIKESSLEGPREVVLERVMSAVQVVQDKKKGKVEKPKKDQ